MLSYIWAIIMGQGRPKHLKPKAFKSNVFEISYIFKNRPISSSPKTPTSPESGGAPRRRVAERERKRRLCSATRSACSPSPPAQLLLFFSAHFLFLILLLHLLRSRLKRFAGRYPVDGASLASLTPMKSSSFIRFLFPLSFCHCTS